jgi:hypothetical protein
MTLDRIFGVIAALGFALGVLAHVEFIVNPPMERDLFSPVVAAFGTCAIVATLYMVGYAGSRDRLNSEDGELDILGVIGELPKGAMAVTGILILYVAAVAFISYAKDGAAVAPAFFRINATVVTAETAFTAVCFLIASYCLLREKSPSASLPE